MVSGSGHLGNVGQAKEIFMRSRCILSLVVLTGLAALPLAGAKAGEDEKKPLQGRTPYKKLSQNPHGLRRQGFWPQARSAEEAMQRRASLRRRNAADGLLPPQPEGTPRILAAGGVARR
jgi:hypothetical protein